ncbi:unnamed protein product [Musa textilis]
MVVLRPCLCGEATTITDAQTISDDGIKGCRSRRSVCAYGCGSPSYLSRPLTTGPKVLLRSYLVLQI